jgi:hypothetical protein
MPGKEADSKGIYAKKGGDRKKPLPCCNMTGAGAMIID